MLVGSILLAVAVLVAVAGVACWLAGVQLAALAKVLLTVLAVGFSAAGAVLVTGEVLTSAGYFDSGRGEPNAQTEVTPPPEPLSEYERFCLEVLHHAAVDTFVGSPGQGVGRMVLTSPDDLIGLGDVVARPKSRSEDAPLVARSRRFAPSGHLGVFAATPFGFRSVESLRGLQDLAIVTDGGKKQWKVRRSELVGLVKHPEPVVYVTDKLPTMEKGEEVPTRELDTFEVAALKILRAGEGLHVEKRGDQLRMLGPIFAGESCVRCHDEKGQLLGAFTYRLERVPVELAEEPK